MVLHVDNNFVIVYYNIHYIIIRGRKPMDETIKSKTTGKKVLKVLLRTLIVLLLTIALLAAFLYSAMLIICCGPSEAARNLFVFSVRETSAIGFLADLVLSDEEIAAIESKPNTEPVEDTDTSLIEVGSTDAKGPVTDKWGYTDEDGDGLILVNVGGESYVGKMLIVLDPSRVVVGCVPESLGYRGYTVQEYAEMFAAVAAINGGGFVDPNGQGDGSMPDTLVVKDGNIYCGSQGIGPGFIGIDSDYILHVGFTSADDIEKWDIQEGIGYGPVLVVNGKIRDSESLNSGLNPRTAIGQRSDGAILMLVIDGRQPTSLGATYQDIAELMLKFGAVNACNLDGGSSTLMYYKGEYVNNCASVIGIRNNPTSFLVLKEGAAKDE